MSKSIERIEMAPVPDPTVVLVPTAVIEAPYIGRHRETAEVTALDMVSFAVQNPGAALHVAAETVVSSVKERWRAVKSFAREARGYLTRKGVAAFLVGPLALGACVSGTSDPRPTDAKVTTSTSTSTSTEKPSTASLTTPEDNGAVAGKDKNTKVATPSTTIAIGQCAAGAVNRDRNADSALKNDTTIDDKSFRARPTEEQLSSKEFATAMLKEMLDPCTGDPVQAASYILTINNQGDMSKLTDADFAAEAKKLQADKKYWDEQVAAIDAARVAGSLKIEKETGTWTTVGINRDAQGKPVVFKHTVSGTRHVASEQFTYIDAETGKPIVKTTSWFVECDQVNNKHKSQPVAKKPAPVTKKITKPSNPTPPKLTCPPFKVPGYASDKTKYEVTVDSKGCSVGVKKKAESPEVKKDGGTVGTKQASANNTTSGAYTGPTKTPTGEVVTEPKKAANPAPLPATPPAPTESGTKGTQETSPSQGSAVVNAGVGTNNSGAVTEK